MSRRRDPMDLFNLFVGIFGSAAVGIFAVVWMLTHH